LASKVLNITLKASKPKTAKVNPKINISGFECCDANLVINLIFPKNFEINLIKIKHLDDKI